MAGKMGSYLDELRKRNESRKATAQKKTSQLARYNRGLERVKSQLPKKYGDFEKGKAENRYWDMQKSVLNEKQREDYGQPKERYEGSVVKKPYYKEPIEEKPNPAKYARMHLGLVKGPQARGLQLDDNLKKNGTSWIEMYNRVKEDEKKRKEEKERSAFTRALNKKYGK